MIKLVALIGGLALAALLPGHARAQQFTPPCQSGGAPCNNTGQPVFPPFIAGALLTSPIPGTVNQYGTNVFGQIPPSQGACIVGTATQWVAAKGSACPGGGNVPVATSTTLGISRPDNTTITIANGVLTAVGGGGGGLNQLTGAVLAGPGTGSQVATVPGIGAVPHEWISAISTANVGTLSQPNFTDLAGTASAAQLAALNTAAVSHEWINSIVSGAPVLTQPAFTDISGTAAPGQLPVATTGAFGAIKPDGVTVTISGGVISATSGGTGCLVSGGAGIVLNNGSSACVTDTDALLSTGALSLGSSGTAGSVALGNATSGTVTLQPVTGALGTVTASLSANSGTIAELNLAQSWSAVQTFSSTPVISAITNSGTLTLPTTTGTILESAGTNTVSGTLNVSGTFEIGGTTIVAEATPSAFGAVKPDNVTIGSTAGVLAFLPAAAFGTPASSSAACTQGQSEFDGSFLYTCISTNTWLRLASGATW